MDSRIFREHIVVTVNARAITKSAEWSCRPGVIREVTLDAAQESGRRQKCLHVLLAHTCAAVAVLVLVSLPVLLGIAVLTIDVGHIYNVRAELQTASDAAALAAASVLADDPDYGEEICSSDEAALRAIAQQFSAANHDVDGILANADRIKGFLNTL